MIDEGIVVQSLDDIGIVVIGRNEGERLKRCLCSVLRDTTRIVYVDSGSNDGSVAYAKSVKIHVVELDTSTPFSAARARNEGFACLNALYPQLKYVQFIDGDCELIPGWLSSAQEFMSQHKTVAVVFGRRKERYPEQSVYNLLCDIEWNTPVGETRSCGGDAFMRVNAFLEVKGFNPTVVAGEEPDLCFRLREKKWKIIRLDVKMTLHDAAILHFRQWWKRCMRSGHAYAQGVALRGLIWSDNNFQHTLRNWFFGIVTPVIFFMLFYKNLLIGLAVLVFLYFLQTFRLALHLRKRCFTTTDSLLYAFFIILGRWPQVAGQLKFICMTLRKNKPQLIEYK